MMFSHLIILMLSSLWAAIKSESSPCFIESKISDTLCLACNFEYNILFNDSWPGGDVSFQRSDCKLMEKRQRWEFYVSPKKCEVLSSCDGTVEFPFDNMISAFKEGWRRNAAELAIYLLSDFKITGEEFSDHFINKEDFPSEYQYIFRRFYADITLSPLYCSAKSVKGCIKTPALRPTVYVRVQSLYFFIAKTLLISNLIFDGSEIYLAHKGLLKVENLRARACTDEELAGLSKPGGHCDLRQAIADAPRSDVIYGLFNLEIPIDCEFCVTGSGKESLRIHSTDFRYFHSFREPYSLASLITVQGIGFGIYIFNSTISKLCFPRGIIYNIAIPPFYQDVSAEYNKAKAASAENFLVFEASSVRDYNYFDVQWESETRLSSVIFISLIYATYDIKILSSVFDGFRKIDQTRNSSYFCYTQTRTDLEPFGSNITIVGSAFTNMEIDYLFGINRIYLLPAYSRPRLQLILFGNTLLNNVNTCFNLSLTDVFFYKNNVSDFLLTSSSFFSIMYGQFFAYENVVTRFVDLFSGAFIDFKGPIVYADKTIFDSVTPSNMSFYEAADLQSNNFSEINFAIVRCNYTLSFFLLRHNSIKNVKNNAINVTRAKVERELVIENNIIMDVSCFILLHHECFKNITFAGNIFRNITVSALMDSTLYSPMEPFGQVNISNNFLLEVRVLRTVVSLLGFYPNSGIYIFFSNNILRKIAGSRSESILKMKFSAALFCRNIIDQVEGLSSLSFAGLSNGNLSILFNDNMLRCSVTVPVSALLVLSGFRLAVISGTYFFGNKIRNSAAASIYAVAQNGTLRVLGSCFINLSAISTGALMVKLWKPEHLLIKDCIFYNNEGADYSGDITLEFSFKNRVFLTNVTIRLTEDYGLISNFLCYSKGGKGGAVALLEGSQFFSKENVFLSGQAKLGTTFFARQETEVLIYRDISAKSIAFDAGSFLYIVSAKGKLIEIIIFACSSVKGAGIYSEGSTLDVYYSLFSNLTATFGTGLYSLSSILTLNTIVIADSLASGDGGALFIKWGKSLIVQSKFYSNRALNNGGSLYIEALSQIIAKKIIISRSLAEGDGIFYVIGQSESWNIIEELSCEQSSANGKGDCLCLMQGSFKIKIVAIKSSKVENCAVCLLANLQGVVMVLYDLSFENNTFKNNGLEISGSTFYLSNLSFTRSQFQPKFIFIRLSDSYLNLEDAYFEGGPKGLRFLSAEGSQFDLDSIILQLNDSMGGISVTQSQGSAIRHTKIFRARSDTEEDSKGGCLYLVGSQIVMTDILFGFSHAAQGGAIYSVNSDLVVFYGYFIDNFAEALAGADVYSLSSAEVIYYELYLSGCVFLGAPGILVSKINTVNLERNYLSQTKRGESALKIDDGLTISIESLDLRGFRHNTFSALEIRTGLKQETVLKIANMRIKFCYSADSGGALTVDGMINITIQDSVFANNTSDKDGGAIYLNVPADCCSVSFANCKFIHNKAKAYGNIMKVMSHIPQIFSYDRESNETLSMDVNSSDFSSYPHLVVALEGIEWKVGEIKNVIEKYKRGTAREELEKNFTFSEFASGQVIALTCVVLDHYLNIMSLDYGGKITFQNEDPQSQVINFDNEAAKVSDGIARFDKLVLVAEPGHNYTVAIKYSNENSRTELSQLITFFSRRCKKGEVYSGMKCEICPRNFFSLSHDPINDKKSTCDPCKENSVCPGGNLILPFDGYWRRDENQTQVFKCRVSEACPQGNLTSVLKSGSYVAVCNHPYKGNLCFSCQEGHGKSETNICKPCTMNDTFFLKFVSLLFFSMFVSIYQIWTFFDFKQSANSTKRRCLLKLLVDHFTFIGLIYRFKIDWSQVIDLLLSFNEFYLMSIPAIMLEFDCFLNDMVENSQKFYLNSILVSLSPFFYGAITFISIYVIKVFYKLIWSLLQRMKQRAKYLIFMNYLMTEDPSKSSPGFRQNFYVTCLIIFYNFYPRLQMNGMLWVQCSALDDSGVPFLENNPDIQCWDREHIFFVLSIALPTLAGWSIGIPLLLFYTTRRMKRNKVKETPGGQNLLLFLTLDYKERYYFWDSFSYLSKFLIVFCAMVTNGLEPSSQGALLIFVMLCILLAQEYAKPYNHDFLNNMFSCSYVTVICTGAFAIMASAKGIKESLKTVYLAGLILINILFYLIWFVFFLKNGIDWEYSKKIVKSIWVMSKKKLSLRS